MKKLFTIFAALCIGMAANAQKWEGVADTPQMGWSSWNKFQGNINEQLIMGIADAIVESGLKDAWVAGTGRLDPEFGSTDPVPVTLATFDS